VCGTIKEPLLVARYGVPPFYAVIRIHLISLSCNIQSVLPYNCVYV